LQKRLVYYGYFVHNKQYRQFGGAKMTVTATEIKNRFGEYLDEAQNAPITVEKNNRPRAVLVSYDEYQRLTALHDAYWLQRATEAERSGYMGAEESLALLQAGLGESEE
jgi:antitoxin Phd